MQEPLPVEAVDEVLAGILARPEFQPPAPAPLWRALGMAWDWVWARLGDLLAWLAPGLESAAPAWATAGRVGLVLLGVLGLGVLVRLAHLWTRGLWGRARRAGSGGTETADPAPRTAEEWEELARTAAREERWREAVRALYQAVLHRLARDERVRLDPGKTPGDYRRELADDPGAGPLLERFLRHWEPVAFGPRPPGRSAWEDLLYLARALGTRG